MPINPTIETNLGTLPGVVQAIADVSREANPANGVLPDNAITNNQLSPGSVQAGQILAGSIIAGHLSANSVDTAALQALSINAGKIQTDAIEARHIKAREIDATKIATATLTATEIASGTITSDKLYAGAVQASLIQAANIAAGAITANEIHTGTLEAIWATAGTLTGGTITGGVFQSALSGVNPRIRIDSSGIYATDGSGNPSLQYSTTTGNVIISGKFFASNDSVVPADAVDATTLAQITNALGTITSGFFGSGTVSTNASPGYTGARVEMNSSGIFGYNASNVEKFSFNNTSGALSAVGGTITGGTVQTATSGSRVVLTSSGLVAYGTDGTTEKLKFDTSTGIGTITGGVFQTATSGSRVVLSSSGLVAYGTDGTTEKLKFDTSTGIGTLTGGVFQTSATDPKVRFDGTDAFFSTDASGNKVVNLTTTGLKILSGTSSSPPTERRIRWMNGTATGADLFNYVSGTTFNGMYVQVYNGQTGNVRGYVGLSAGSGGSGASLTSISQGGTITAEFVTAAQDGAGAAGNNVGVNVTGAGLKYLLKSDGTSDFLLLAGTQTVTGAKTFSGGLTHSYASGHLTISTSGIGIYNSSTSVYWYSDANSRYRVQGGHASVVQIRLDRSDGAAGGYVYSASDGFGLLNGAGNWAHKMPGSYANANNTAHEWSVSGATYMVLSGTPGLYVYSNSGSYVQSYNPGAGISIYLETRPNQLPGVGGSYPILAVSGSGYMYGAINGNYSYYIVGTTGQYVPVSDPRKKKNVTRSRGVLDRFLSVPIYDWTHKDDDEGMRGPMAPDFYRAFPELKLKSPTGHVDVHRKMLSYSDRMGVLEASLQELAVDTRRNEARDSDRIDMLEQAVLTLASEIGALKKEKHK